MVINVIQVVSVLGNFKQVVKDGDLRLHPIIGRLVDKETLEKMGAARVIRSEKMVEIDSVQVKKRFCRSGFGAFQRARNIASCSGRKFNLFGIRIFAAATLIGGAALAAPDRVEEYTMNITVLFATPIGPQKETFAIRIETAYARDGNGEMGLYTDVAEGESKVVTFHNGSKAAILVHAMTGAMPHSLEKSTGLKRIKTTERLQIFQELSKPISLDESLWPWIVTFEDPSDPLSIVRITNETIEEIIGRGYWIEQVEIENSVSEPLKTGEIFEWLPWLRDWPPSTTLDGKKFHTRHTDFPLANSLTDWSFLGIWNLGLKR